MRLLTRMRVTSALLMAIVAAIAAVGPATAQVLSSSAEGSTVKCRYEVTQAGRYGWTEADIRKIAVTPPTLYALRTRQVVGWRFVVQRSINRGPWKSTYSSPIQKATARSDQPASFDPMKVQVSVPTDPNGDWDAWDVQYRVVLKMFWYRSDGTKELIQKHLVDAYRIYVGTTLESVDEESCRGQQRQFFDGP